MKPCVALLALALLRGDGAAQPAPAPEPAPPVTKPAPAAATGKSSAPLPRIILGGDAARKSEAKSAAPGAASPTEPTSQKSKKREETPKIEGLEIARGAQGGYLGLLVEGAVFKLSFYDEKRKPAKPDVVRAMLRWTPNYKPGTEIYILTPSGDGKMLTAAKNVRPPYQFKLFISLFAEGVEDPTESYVVDFRQ